MELAEKQSLIEDFVIEGLYGYRTVGLSSKHAATILIAQNGSGKTTLLAALDAFLKCQFIRLGDLQFTRIKCRLRGIEEDLILNQEDLTENTQQIESSELANHARQMGFPTRVLREFLELEYPKLRRDFRQLSDNEIFSKITALSGYVHSTALKRADELASIARQLNPATEALAKRIRGAIGNVEIVYLPTYRRIELPLTSDGSDVRPGRKKASAMAKLGLTNRGLYDAEIRFGLSDISERLSELNQEILVSSNQGYREISANILNELLDGTFDLFEPDDSKRPDKESLALFFSRIKEGRHRIPYRDISIPNLDQVYGEGAGTPHAKKFLAYFLSKLDTVINATRGIEERVEEFIRKCNRYLASEDASTRFVESSGSESNEALSDDKLLVLDRKNLKVLVHSIAANKRILLDSLSSGEKQMISLFARLHLYEGEKIFLIDEPELSLSIDWQRKILLDVVSASTCRQVIAITHSPFVFDNELEPFARSLRLEIQRAVPASEDDALGDDVLSDAALGDEIDE